MSQDQKQGRVMPLSGTEAKTPLERARQVQELQRQMDAPAAAPQSPQSPFTPAAPVNETQKAAASTLQKAEVFEPKPVEAASIITGPVKQGADQLGYGATQVDETALFGLGGGTAHEVTGNPWKIIHFGDPPERQLAPILDLKKPVAEYAFVVPPKSIKIKQGHLFEVGFKPAAGGAGPMKRQAVIVDEKGVIKGAEFKSAKALEQGLAGLPGFALRLFQQAFGEGLNESESDRMKVLSVSVGDKSAYKAEFQYRNPVNGKETKKTVILNNFGMKVSESRDRQQSDIILRMYRLDSFEAAPPPQS